LIDIQEKKKLPELNPGTLLEHKSFDTGIVSIALILSIISMGMLCSIYQRYNLKAIHNQDIMIKFFYLVVLNISKIQSESNSQLRWARESTLLCCAQYIKDTI